jgi:hypothetical protein
MSRIDGREPLSIPYVSSGPYICSNFRHVTISSWISVLCRSRSGHVLLGSQIRSHNGAYSHRTHWSLTSTGLPSGCLAMSSGSVCRFLHALTMISDDPLQTYALGRKIFRAHHEQGDFHVCPEKDEAKACLESWSYDPRILSRAEIVDTLSLYLSLRDSADERVQQQLENLIREFPW